MTSTAVVGTLLAVGLWSLSGGPRPPQALTTIQLRVFAHATMDAPALELARSTAARLLDSGGIRIGWRNCGSGEDACSEGGAETPITVLLMPMTKLGWEDVAGEARHGGTTPVPTVLVYLPNLEDRLLTLRQSAAGRSDPALAALRLGHLVGLTIAHEIGHTFGLPHAASGIMKARIANDDLPALATFRLAFTPKDVSALRQSPLVRR